MRPCRRFARSLTGTTARLGERYGLVTSFTTEDFHLLYAPSQLGAPLGSPSRLPSLSQECRAPIPQRSAGQKTRKLSAIRSEQTRSSALAVLPLHRSIRPHPRIEDRPQTIDPRNGHVLLQHRADEVMNSVQHDTIGSVGALRVSSQSHASIQPPRHSATVRPSIELRGAIEAFGRPPEAGR